MGLILGLSITLKCLHSVGEICSFNKQIARNFCNMATQKTHFKCRNSAYPYKLEQIDRFPVPDDKVSWQTSWPDYRPKSFTAKQILGQPWADPEVNDSDFNPTWNEIDEKVNRKSFEGVYDISDGIPRNPIGRTGVSGRGLLGRWGPNHAADPIVTRWKRDSEGKTVIDENTKKPILQFVCIQRKDCKEWAFPGGMVDPGERVTQTLQREFREEALNSLCLTDEQKAALEKTIGSFFKEGNVIYQGYIDDPRNTDHAWMESVASNFHDVDGTSVGQFPLHAGDDAAAVQWKDASSSLILYASHGGLLRRVVDTLNAHW